MRHRWQNKPFEADKSRVVDQCSRCGLVRTRTPARTQSFAGGFRTCITVDERLNKQNDLARIINRDVRFFAPVLLICFVSCFPARHYSKDQVLARILAKPNHACRVAYSDTSYSKPLNK